MIRRNKPLRGSAKPLKRTSLKRVSTKQANKLRTYRLLRDSYMEANPMCEYPGCNSPAQDLHHKAKRGANLCNAETFCALCRDHHNWCHQHPAEARTLGLLP